MVNKLRTAPGKIESSRPRHWPVRFALKLLQVLLVSRSQDFDGLWSR
jgi:hypothetical protein